jgi:hypothetical protein
MNAVPEEVHTGIQKLAGARAWLLYRETGKRVTPNWMRRLTLRTNARTPDLDAPQVQSI